MIHYIIPLLDSFLSLEFFEYWFYPLFCLAFVATVPCLIRLIFRRKK